MTAAPAATSAVAALPSSAPAAAADPPVAEESPLASALSVVTTLGPPLSIVTALMFYFGWARSDVQARYMGLDVSLFGYSTQDYVLRSIRLLYIPLLGTAVFAIGWLMLHRRVVVALGHPPSRRPLRVAGQTGLAGGLLVAAAAVLAVTVDRALAPLAIPLAVAAGTAIAAYGGWLTGAARDADAPAPVLPRWHQALRTLAIGGVITLAVFWEVSNYAGVVGRGYAMQVARSVPELPRATAISSMPLGIQAPGVREVQLAGGPAPDRSAPRYRTTGLRFLVHSGGRMFLLHDGWTPRRGTVIVLADSDQVRWQFSRG